MISRFPIPQLPDRPTKWIVSRRVLSSQGSFRNPCSLLLGLSELNGSANWPPVGIPCLLGEPSHGRKVISSLWLRLQNPHRQEDLPDRQRASQVDTQIISCNTLDLVQWIGGFMSPSSLQIICLVSSKVKSCHTLFPSRSFQRSNPKISSQVPCVSHPWNKSRSPPFCPHGLGCG